ncbi:type VI secretion protein Vgr [Betaproteobacteria bacterium]|nr:type VI secretion protein Vgr [Betaproteobacteria bacterium]GHU47558.1 type VI secretion protein Vgr [Betaproteobacteria bacterium]
MSHTVSVNCAAMPSPPLEFFEISGVETLSALYSYTILLKTPGDPGIPRQVAANANYKQMVGKEFTVAIELTDLSKREISGLVTSARIIESNDQQSIYEVIIEPWLILATRTSDYKRFQEKTVVQIIDEVLADYNFPVEKRLSGSYPSLDYQVQYGETDFDFIQRLMEEWGIYWFFKHEGGMHKLVLIDNMAAHTSPPSADYQTVIYNTDGKIDEEHLSVFHAEENHRSGQWVVNDFDFKKPLADLKVIDPKPRNTGFPSQELYEWPGDYTDPGIGQQLALVRMYAEGVAGSIAHASGNVRGLPCGYTFTLAQNPTDKTNQQYLIVSSSMSLRDIGKTSGQSDYHCNVGVSLLPTKKIFRPLRTVSKPRTRGPQTAIVVGPPGEEIYTDKYGRVKVQFHWDRYGKKDQDSSRWIRVTYPWAGDNFGGIHIPRIGQEVVVDFENGDPDRPIVVGKVYNALNMPPWGLPDNATQSGLLTRSSRGGGPDNANALRFEDKKGEEEVWLHAEKDMRTEVEHNESHTVDVDRNKTVGGNEDAHVVGKRTHKVDQDEEITVSQSQSTDVGLDLTLVAGESITFRCGASSIVMDKSGNITINGVQVTAIGSDRIDLNPD